VPARAQRLLDLIVPDFVHVMIEGKIVQTGGKARSRALALRMQNIRAGAREQASMC
jgi:Fe-S cluster assembly ATPase SufC